MRFALSAFFEPGRDTANSLNAKECLSSGIQSTQMTVLSDSQLRHVAGGIDDQLPKGGWIVASVSND
jgi:hypothetical protein